MMSFPLNNLLTRAEASFEANGYSWKSFRLFFGLGITFIWLGLLLTFILWASGSGVVASVVTLGGLVFLTALWFVVSVTVSQRDSFITVWLLAKKTAKPKKSLKRAKLPQEGDDSTLSEA